MRLRKQYENHSLLIIDEWLLFPISKQDSEVPLSLINRRHNVRSTIVMSQFEPAECLHQIPVRVAVEAIIDRLSVKAFKTPILGTKSMRSI